MTTTMIISLIAFVLMYILMLIFTNKRTYIVLGFAFLFVIFQVLPIEFVIGSISWNVILMIFGTMGLVALFIESKMPALLADKIIMRVPNVKWAVIALSLFAGVVSAFVDNVATVLMVAPIAMTIAKKLNISPVAVLISISVASNLEGAATLVGDTTSIMLGAHLNMNFNDFFIYQGKIGLFFITQLGIIAATTVLLFIFRKYNQPITIEEKTEVTDYFPSVLMILVVVLLIIASFIPYKIELPLGTYDNANNLMDITNGVICLTLLIVGLIWKIVKTKDIKCVLKVAKEIDYFTLLLLIGLFVVIGSIGKAGVINEIGIIIGEVSGGNPFIAFTIIVWISVLLSAFIDNIPYVMVMLGVVGQMCLGNPALPETLLYFGLIIGATLGGNLTPIGASANITTIGILRKEGYEVKLSDYMRIGVPYTLVAVIVGYIMVWLIWS